MNIYFTEGAGLMEWCSFWTGINKLPSSTNNESMLVKFDANIELPIVETCFNSMTIPSKFHTFEDFAKKMDVAIKYGSKGSTSI